MANNNNGVDAVDIDVDEKKSHTNQQGKTNNTTELELKDFYITIEGRIIDSSDRNSSKKRIIRPYFQFQPQPLLRKQRRVMLLGLVNQPTSLLILIHLLLLQLILLLLLLLMLMLILLSPIMQQLNMPQNYLDKVVVGMMFMLKVMNNNAVMIIIMLVVVVVVVIMTNNNILL